MWDIPCHCGDIEMTLIKMFKDVSKTLQEFCLSQQTLNYQIFKAVTQNCQTLRKCLIHLNSKDGYEDEYINEITLDLNDPNMCSKFFHENTDVHIFLTRKNEGPGFEKVQVCKKPAQKAKLIHDWDGITHNLRQSINLQYSDIGRYLLPLQN